MEVSLGKTGKEMRQEMEGMRDTGRSDGSSGERLDLRTVRQKRRLETMVRGNAGERQAVVSAKTQWGSGCRSGSI